MIQWGVMGVGYSLPRASFSVDDLKKINANMTPTINMARIMNIVACALLLFFMISLGLVGF